MIFLGIDTSNYTTSMASVGAVERSCAQLLPVKPEELGLRQSDALFAPHLDGGVHRRDLLLFSQKAGQGRLHRLFSRIFPGLLQDPSRGVLGIRHQA